MTICFFCPRKVDTLSIKYAKLVTRVRSQTGVPGQQLYHVERTVPVRSTWADYAHGS